ncbi:hypothetical protein CROQUDRAFT_109207 [Cronartium quercuum f. sp. fusiforme G11]|uniref:Uncharacterized protein n=1 Tax=Cronartium quercuum f. sp. fusiforme G11 TaxID=708437 RepID=A0A9P6T8W9_9BASI|nr:hypothetical protein CROQUDRAFT_109207 [Cronartium quercuum f. sp. fusiforme G11]
MKLFTLALAFNASFMAIFLHDSINAQPIGGGAASSILDKDVEAHNLGIDFKFENPLQRRDLRKRTSESLTVSSYSLGPLTPIVILPTSSFFFALPWDHSKFVSGILTAKLDSSRRQAHRSKYRQRF